MKLTSRRAGFDVYYSIRILTQHVMLVKPYNIIDFYDVSEGSESVVVQKSVSVQFVETHQMILATR